MKHTIYFYLNTEFYYSVSVQDPSCALKLKRYFLKDSFTPKTEEKKKNNPNPKHSDEPFL